MISLKLKHWLYEYHLLVTLLLISSAFLLCWKFSDLRTSNFLISAVGAILGFSYFVLKQHLEEARLFKELYKDFNERYARMNDRLYELRDSDTTQEIQEPEKQFLFDYFNLCSEEYLYYRKGFIYPEVWMSWQNGMAIFWESPKIRALWQEELKTNSYYGMPAPIKQQ